MKPAVEQSIRSVLALDGEIPQRHIEEAICVMKGDDKNPISPLHYVRFKEVYELTGLTPTSISSYIKQGILEPVYHPGRNIIPIGVTRKSYKRMTERRTPYWEKA